MYMYMYIYIDVYIYIYICIHIYMYTYIRIYIYMYMYICIYVYIYICIYVCIYIYVLHTVFTYVEGMRGACVCVYILTYTHTHTHTDHRMRSRHHRHLSCESPTSIKLSQNCDTVTPNIWWFFIIFSHEHYHKLGYIPIFLGLLSVIQLVIYIYYITVYLTISWLWLVESKIMTSLTIVPFIPFPKPSLISEKLRWMGP